MMLGGWWVVGGGIEDEGGAGTGGEDVVGDHEHLAEDLHRVVLWEGGPDRWVGLFGDDGLEDGPAVVVEEVDLVDDEEADQQGEGAVVRLAGDDDVPLFGGGDD